MNEPSLASVSLQFSLLSDMEKCLWAVTMGQHADDADGGVGAADAQINRLRELAVTREQRLDPEYEAARANIQIDPAEFAGWYIVQLRLGHRHGQVLRVDPTSAEIAAAYERYCRARSDFW